jgi:TPR repeat protein
MYRKIVIIMLLLGLVSCNGGGVKPDDDMNDLETCKNLIYKDKDENKSINRRALSSCKKVPTIIGKGYVARALYTLDRKKEALEIYEKISSDLNKKCLEKNTDACNILSRYFFDIKESKRSFYFSKKSCDFRNHIGCNNLGYAYSHGVGVKKDKSKSSYFFKKSCDLGGTLGCTNLGINHETGKNTAKSLVLYGNACNKNDAEGCQLLGNIYEQGKDFIKAFSLYEKSCNLNSISLYTTPIS